MTTEGKPGRWIEALAEPALIVSESGDVTATNTAAQRALGQGIAGANLAEMAHPSPHAFRAYLRRCSGSGSPLVGSLSVRRNGSGLVSFETHGAVYSPAGASHPARVMLRCLPRRSARFSLLSDKVRQLDSEIRMRRRAQRVLEESLAQRDILLRELQHRVKNNIQMLLSMFAASEREAQDPELRAFLATATNRLLAIGAVQHVMYQSGQFDTISARSFIRTLCEAVGATLDPRVALKVSSDDAALSNDVAFPLALILNELILNAAKHGFRSEGASVEVAFRNEDDCFELSIQDNGPGFAVTRPTRPTSGLGLVNGLSRQLGAKLHLENRNGARCTIRFTDRRRGTLNH